MKNRKINHVGIVVKDYEEAMDRYSKLFGIKHWYESLTDEGSFDMYYHGVKTNSNVRLFWGGKGTTKIELIYTTGEKNIYDRFYEKHGEGIHHIEYMTKDLDKTIKEMEAKGLQVIQNANFTSNGAKLRYAYMGKNEDDIIYEFVECAITKHIKKGDMPAECILGTLTGNYKKIR